MNPWKRKIVKKLIKHYLVSAPNTEESRAFIRINAAALFPDFDSAHPDEKELYLEAMERLEQRKLIKIHWEKRAKGERLRGITCRNFERLFRIAGRPFPRAEIEKTKAMLGEKVQELKKSLVTMKGDKEQAEKVITLLEFLSMHFGLREIKQGLDHKVMEDLVKLLEFHFNPSGLEKITSRALSILLYQDSKHLEDLPAFCHHLFKRLQKSIAVPDITFMQRSFPETLISGKIAIEYKNYYAPLINENGHILGLPLETVDKIAFIDPAYINKKSSSGFKRRFIKLLRKWKKHEEKTALIIENKETFYALATPQKNNTNKHLQYDCFLYAGGYPNRAVVALIKILAASDFTLYYAGDMDPDGILILQHIRDIVARDFAGKPITPVKMDVATFEKYLPWARNLSKAVLQQMERVREDTKAIPGLADLVQRIKETGQGVEQEIVDYR
jgi:hypothetical protein